jgi:phosphoglycerate dehydrogenase-like enzyme
MPSAISGCPVEPMSLRVLIVDMHAGIYEEQLRRAFPALVIHTAESSAELPKSLSHVDVLVAFGVAIDDDLLRRLDNLKWVQSLATGVDHFLRSPALAPKALITSGRGIHGPMMREMVTFLMLCLSHKRAAPGRGPEGARVGAPPVDPALRQDRGGRRHRRLRHRHR